MEPGPLLLLLLAALWGRGWAASGHAPAGETGKCLETSTNTTSPCKPTCSSKCPGSSGCGQECQQVKEDFHPPIDPDPTTNCKNKCRDDSNCRGSSRFHCPQQVPASPDTDPKKKVPHTSSCCNSTCSSDLDCPDHLRRRSPPGRSSRLSLSLAMLSFLCYRCSEFKKLCNQSPDRGPCTNFEYRYAYFADSKSCRQFLYGGCKGNANNFHTLRECKRVCHSGLDKH